MERKSQRTTILNYLQKNKKGVTSMKAFWRWHITRLSAIIFDLREKDYNIITIREPNTFCSGSHARYVLLPKDSDWSIL